MARILVVDDERGIRTTVSRFLLRDGYDVEIAEDANEAWEKIEQNKYDVVITDILMPKSSGFDLLEKIVGLKDTTKVIMITGEPGIDAATKALRMGAFDFFAKPVSRKELSLVVSRALKVKELEDENLAYKERLEELIAKRTESLYEANLKLQEEIDEKQKVRQDLELHEQNYKIMADNINDIIWVMDINSMSVVYCSPSTEHITGYKVEEVLKLSIEENIAEESLPFVLEQLSGAMIEASRVKNPQRTFEAILNCKDGGTIAVEISAKILRDKDGNPDRVLGVSRNISERKVTENKLRASEERYKKLVENMNQGLMSVDSSGVIKIVNPKICNMLQYEEHELVGKMMQNFVAKSDVDLFLKNYKQREKGSNEPYRLNFFTKSGEIVPTLVSPQPVFSDEGKFEGSYAVFSNILERDSALELLEFERKQLLSIFDTMEEIVFVSDLGTCEIIYMNAHAQNILGESYGVKCYDIIEGRADNCKNCLKQIMGSEYPVRLERWQKEGNKIQQKWFKCNSKAISWPDGRNVKIHLVVDITELHEAENELRRHRDNLEELIYDRTDQLQTSNIKLKEEIIERERTEEKLRHAVEVAESATQAKSDFLANMSHEIRTPMNGVIGMTTLLLQTELDKDQKSYAEIIQKSAAGLLTLINDILDFSKIEAGKLEIEKIDFDLRQTIEDIGDMLAFRAREKDLDFVIDIDPDVPSLVIGDPTRLRQVIVNLTDNAIKFTEKGEISLSISLEMETAKSVKLRFAVKDTGIGIPRKIQPLLFDAFIQGDPSRTRKFGGTGLGLTICKKFINLMGGKIGLESVQSQGSEFWFTIGLEKQPERIVDHNDVTLDLSGERIMVVDKNDKHTVWMEKLLSSWGCRYAVVFDEKKILTELGMAIRDGDPFTMLIVNYDIDNILVEMMVNRIRKASEFDDLVLVVMANLGKRGDALRMKRLGFSAYITKPVKQSVLFDCLVEVVDSRKHDKAVFDENKIITKYSVADKKRQQRQKILVVEDDVINQKVASLVVQKLGYIVKVADNGEKAIEELKKNEYDLVLMDCTMPIMDGYEASRKIRSVETGVQNSQIPIIAMTAHAFKEERDKCFASGMNDYVSKPIDVEVLTSKIKETLK